MGEPWRAYEALEICRQAKGAWKEGGARHWFHFQCHRQMCRTVYNLYTSRACASQAHAQVELYRCAPGGRGAPRWISRNIKPNVLLAAEIFKL